MSCFVWRETDGGFVSDVFASIMIRFLTSEIQKHKPSKIIVVEWSNVQLSNGLLELIMEQTVCIEHIEQRYWRKWIIPRWKPTASLAILKENWEELQISVLLLISYALSNQHERNHHHTM